MSPLAHSDNAVPMSAGMPLRVKEWAYAGFIFISALYIRASSLVIPSARWGRC
jgi:hypothetical protein